MDKPKAPAVVTFEGIEYDAARLLAALHNGTRPLGLGILHATPPITVDEAARDLAECKSFDFDYYRGRPLKVRAKADGVINPHSAVLYDRDAGPGAFARALAQAHIRR